LAGARVILGDTIAADRAALSATSLPVVMLGANDPVGSGLVASLARPGGRITGMSTQNEDLTPKMLQFTRVIVPSAKTLAVVFNPTNPTNPSNPKLVEHIGSLAGPMGMTVQGLPLRFPEELDTVLAALNAAKPDAAQIVADAAIYNVIDGFASFGLAHRLPVFTGMPEFVDMGGLLGYGPSRRGLSGRAAYFVKRILEGANPADLPVEQPNGIELWLNQKTAKAIGVTLPPEMLTLADSVAE
jgi:putative tryptophan/tyrosine transport system substrate-binding protein